MLVLSCWLDDGLTAYIVNITTESHATTHIVWIQNVFTFQKALGITYSSIHCTPHGNNVKYVQLSSKNVLLQLHNVSFAVHNFKVLPCQKYDAHFGVACQCRY